MARIEEFPARVSRTNCKNEPNTRRDAMVRAEWHGRRPITADGKSPVVGCEGRNDAGPGTRGARPGTVPGKSSKLGPHCPVGPQLPLRCDVRRE
ncbi:hypothetical protein GCM10010515_42090 [Streptomyces fructofermentans]|uniref:Uncharacterized protein n=1 Tax=Streptomyces fructofermentans TaxID=152141 RepID=A0A918KNM8_9ACTN|nr:hypothetical protein GCM10010515_42090 [Streptomyces fructofermentans]